MSIFSGNYLFLEDGSCVPWISAVDFHFGQQLFLFFDSSAVTVKHQANSCNGD